MIVTVPRLLITSLFPEEGVSTLHIGLALALKKRRVSASASFRRSDVQQGSLFSRVFRRNSIFIQSSYLNPAQLNDSLFRASLGADIALIEGDLLFSSQGISDFDFALTTGTPVLIVIDLLKVKQYGVDVYRQLLSKIDPSMSAIVFNNVSHGVLGLRETLSHSHRVLGDVPTLAISHPFTPREASCLEHSGEAVSRQYFVQLTQSVSDGVLVDELVDFSKKSIGFTYDDELTVPRQKKCRIAYADDSCTGFSFGDNFELLKFYGAEVVSFSLLSDSQLPQKVDGVYIQGANLFEYGGEISSNRSLLDSLYAFYRKGGILITEGSGSALLAEKYMLGGSDDKDSLPGAKILAGTARFRPSYSEDFLYRCFEDSAFGEIGAAVKGFSNQEWSFEHRGGIWNLFEGKSNQNLIQDGFSSGPNVICFGGFVHFGSNKSIPRRIVEACSGVER